MSYDGGFWPSVDKATRHPPCTPEGVGNRIVILYRGAKSCNPQTFTLLSQIRPYAHRRLALPFDLPALAVHLGWCPIP